MKRLGEIKFRTFLGMDRLRKTSTPQDEEFGIINSTKKGKKVGTWDSYMDLDTTERSKLRALFGRSKGGKGKEWGEEIPLDSPRRENDSHGFAPPPPYYAAPSTANRIAGGVAGPSFRRADGHHALGDSKTKVVSMDGALTSPEFEPRTLRPPPRPYRAPASDSCIRPLQRVGISMGDEKDGRMVKFDDVYGEGGSNRMERAERKSLPDVPYSPVFGTLSLGYGDEGETRRVEHGWI